MPRSDLPARIIHGAALRLACDATLIVPDMDATDDPTHDDQQLSFFHGFYDPHSSIHCSCGMP